MSELETLQNQRETVTNEIIENAYDIIDIARKYKGQYEGQLIKTERIIKYTTYSVSASLILGFIFGYGFNGLFVTTIKNLDINWEVLVPYDTNLTIDVKSEEIVRIYPIGESMYFILGCFLSLLVLSQL